MAQDPADAGRLSPAAASDSDAASQMQLVEQLQVLNMKLMTMQNEFNMENNGLRIAKAASDAKCRELSTHVAAAQEENAVLQGKIAWMATFYGGEAERQRKESVDLAAELQSLRAAQVTMQSEFSRENEAVRTARREAEERATWLAVQLSDLEAGGAVTHDSRVKLMTMQNEFNQDNERLRAAKAEAENQMREFQTKLMVAQNEFNVELESLRAKWLEREDGLMRANDALRAENDSLTAKLGGTPGTPPPGVASIRDRVKAGVLARRRAGSDVGVAPELLRVQVENDVLRRELAAMKEQHHAETNEFRLKLVSVQSDLFQENAQLRQRLMRSRAQIRDFERLQKETSKLSPVPPRLGPGPEHQAVLAALAAAQARIAVLEGALRFTREELADSECELVRQRGHASPLSTPTPSRTPRLLLEPLLTARGSPSASSAPAASPPASSPPRAAVPNAPSAGIAVSAPATRVANDTVTTAAPAAPTASNARVGRVAEARVAAARQGVPAVDSPTMELGAAGAPPPSSPGAQPSPSVVWRDFPSVPPVTVAAAAVRTSPPPTIAIPPPSPHTPPLLVPQPALADAGVLQRAVAEKLANTSGPSAVDASEAAIALVAHHVSFAPETAVPSPRQPPVRPGGEPRVPLRRRSAVGDEGRGLPPGLDDEACPRDAALPPPDSTSRVGYDEEEAPTPAWTAQQGDPQTFVSHLMSRPPRTPPATPYPVGGLVAQTPWTAMTPSTPDDLPRLTPARPAQFERALHQPAFPDSPKDPLKTAAEPAQADANESPQKSQDFVEDPSASELRILAAEAPLLPPPLCAAAGPSGATQSRAMNAPPAALPTAPVVSVAPPAVAAEGGAAPARRPSTGSAETAPVNPLPLRSPGPPSLRVVDEHGAPFNPPPLGAPPGPTGEGHPAPASSKAPTISTFVSGPTDGKRQAADARHSLNLGGLLQTTASPAQAARVAAGRPGVGLQSEPGSPLVMPDDDGGDEDPITQIGLPLEDVLESDLAGLSVPRIREESGSTDYISEPAESTDSVVRRPSFRIDVSDKALHPPRPVHDFFEEPDRPAITPSRSRHNLPPLRSGLTADNMTFPGRDEVDENTMTPDSFNTRPPVWPENDDERLMDTSVSSFETSGGHTGIPSLEWQQFASPLSGRHGGFQDMDEPETPHH